MRRIGLTTIEALDPLGLVPIFHALYDGTVAAESVVMLRMPFK